MGDPTALVGTLGEPRTTPQTAGLTPANNRTKDYLSRSHVKRSD